MELARTGDSCVARWWGGWVKPEVENEAVDVSYVALETAGKTGTVERLAAGFACVALVTAGGTGAVERWAAGFACVTLETAGDTGAVERWAVDPDLGSGVGRRSVVGMGSVSSSTVSIGRKDNLDTARVGEGWASVAGSEGCEPGYMGEGSESSSGSEVVLKSGGVGWRKTDCSCNASERAADAGGFRKTKPESSPVSTEVDNALLWLLIIRGESFPAPGEDGAEMRCDIVHCG